MLAHYAVSISKLIVMTVVFFAAIILVILQFCWKEMLHDYLNNCSCKLSSGGRVNASALRMWVDVMLTTVDIPVHSPWFP